MTKKNVENQNDSGSKATEQRGKDFDEKVNTILVTVLNIKHEGKIQTQTLVGMRQALTSVNYMSKDKGWGKL